MEKAHLALQERTANVIKLLAAGSRGGRTAGEQLVLLSQALGESAWMGFNSRVVVLFPSHPNSHFRGGVSLQLSLLQDL